jgi:asparagine synthase (glutamine-hydrolysing)
MSCPYGKEAIALAKALQSSCEHVPSGVALAFSGGLDSSVLALMLGEKARLYVCGSEESPDAKAAVRAARTLEMGVIRAPPHDIEGTLRAIGAAIPDRLLAIEATILVPFTTVCMEAVEGLVVTGQGADELFGGYARYLRKSPKDAAAEMKSDFQRLLERGARHERLVAESFGKKALHPFLDKGVVAAADIAPEAHIHGGRRKALLREAARVWGLPEILAEAPKRAAQYGSGATKAIARAAKARKMGVPEYVGWALGKKNGLKSH